MMPARSFSDLLPGKDSTGIIEAAGLPPLKIVKLLCLYLTAFKSSENLIVGKY
jgi:hypothetical protein